MSRLPWTLAVTIANVLKNYTCRISKATVAFFYHFQMSTLLNSEPPHITLYHKKSISKINVKPQESMSKIVLM